MTDVALDYLLLVGAVVLFAHLVRKAVLASVGREVRRLFRETRFSRRFAGNFSNE